MDLALKEMNKRIKRFFEFRWDLLRYNVAVFLADLKHLASGNKFQYFVLPNHNDVLIVLNLVEIEKLKATGEIKYKVKFGRKKIVRRKIRNGRIQKQERNKQVVLSKKAFMVSHMDYRVTIHDILRESFYYTPSGKFKLTDAQRIAKRTEWIKYAYAVRLKAKKPNKRLS